MVKKTVESKVLDGKTYTPDASGVWHELELPSMKLGAVAPDHIQSQLSDTYASVPMNTFDPDRPNRTPKFDTVAERMAKENLGLLQAKREIRKERKAYYRARRRERFKPENIASSVFGKSIGVRVARMRGASQDEIDRVAGIQHRKRNPNSVSTPLQKIMDNTSRTNALLSDMVVEDHHKEHGKEKQASEDKTRHKRYLKIFGGMLLTLGVVAAVVKRDSITNSLFFGKIAAGLGALSASVSGKLSSVGKSIAKLGLVFALKALGVRSLLTIIPKIGVLALGAIGAGVAIKSGYDVLKEKLPAIGAGIKNAYDKITDTKLTIPRSKDDGIPSSVNITPENPGLIEPPPIKAPSPAAPQKQTLLKRSEDAVKKVVKSIEKVPSSLGITTDDEDFTEKHEKFKPGLYMDSGKLAIGYGHDLTPEESKTQTIKMPDGTSIDVSNGKRLTRKQAVELYRFDMDKHSKLGMDNMKKLGIDVDALTKGTKDALSDLFYNAGPNILDRTPKLVEALKNNDKANIAKEISDVGITSKTTGKREPGLVERAQERKEMVLTGGEPIKSKVGTAISNATTAVQQGKSQTPLIIAPTINNVNNSKSVSGGGGGADINDKAATVRTDENSYRKAQVDSSIYSVT